jgi:hypothetical protein
MPRGVYARKGDKVVGLKPSHSRLLEKYKNQISPRDEFLDFNIRGEKAKKISEIAYVLKLMGTSDSFKITVPDFERAYGIGKKGRLYMKAVLKRCGIKNPRVEVAQDMVNIWFVGKVE